MIDIHQLINGLFVGSLMIALGLFPQPLQTITEALIAFRNRIHYRFPIATASLAHFKQCRGVAAIGAMLNLLSFAAYCAHA